MLWERTNLVNQLLRERDKAGNGADILQQVQLVLQEDEAVRNGIKQRLGQGDNEGESNAFQFDFLEAERIFDINSIRKICVDYRLRFLSSHLFKSIIPEEAVTKVNALQKQHNTVLAGFKIMAPSKQFHLKSYDDPLLFAPIGNGYYYLVHKWGNDLNPMRKVMVRPFRDFGSLLVLIIAVSALITFVMTRWLFNGDKTDQFALIAFLFTFKSVCGIALYYCFWKGKNFNTAIWNSEYYNR